MAIDGYIDSIEMLKRDKFQRNIKLLYFLNFFTDFILFAPVAIIYFEKVTGSYALAMGVFSVAYVSSALFEVPTGVFSDLIGRKKTTLLGAASSLICLIIYAAAANFLQLALGAVFQGISRAFYSGNNDALLFDSLKKLGKEKRYHYYLGRTSSMFQIALGIASVMGGIIANFSFELVMWLSAVPQVGSIVVSLMLTDVNASSGQSANVYLHLKSATAQFVNNIRLRFLTIASVIRFSFSESGFFLSSAFINSIWPLWAVGFSYTISFATAAVSFWYSGKIIDKLGPVKTFNFSILYARFAGLLGLGLRNVYSPFIMATSSLTFGTTNVSEESLMQKEFTDSERATMGSIKSFFGNITFGITSFFIGVLADKFGVVSALLVVQVFLFIPLYLYRRVYKFAV